MSFNDLAQLKSKAENFVNRLTQSQAATSNKTSIQAPKLPWNNSSSRFWAPINVDPARWDQLFPYRLLVIDTEKNNKPVSGSSKDTQKQSVKVNISSQKTSASGEAYNTIVNFIPIGDQWVFRLPITPQQLSITDQFAINTSATLRGVLEEHNGVKFKLIQASGTMGVWPYKSSVTSPPASNPSIAQTLFAGTINAAIGAASQVSKVINTATSNSSANKPKRFDPLESEAGMTSTGYYQALALQQFLEQYAEAKKLPEAKSWRLVFDIPKQNQSFIVTPMQFNWQQNAQNPVEIAYSMQLKAWRRVTLDDSVSSTKPSIQSLTPSALQKILNTVTQARVLTSNIVDLIAAVRSDVTRPLDVLRQTSLFIKDLAGVAATAADLPFQIQKDYESSIKESLVNLTDAVDITNDAVKKSMSAIKQSSAQVEGLSTYSVSGGQLGKTAATAQSIDPANNPLKSPEKNFSLMDIAPVTSLSLNNAQQEQVDSAINSVRELTVDDLKTFRSVILELATQLSNNYGTGDAYYSQMYNKPAPIGRLSEITVSEYEILKSLYDVVQSYDVLTATTEIDDAQRQTNMEYVAGLANESGIDFSIPNGKILAPIPFGLNIEQIAARYLGDPQRWLEIVTLNNLRDPYLDENGFQRSLLSNASGRQITISSIENLYIGQRVVLKGISQTPTARKILSIDKLSDTSYLLSLDGEADLDNFTLANSSYLQAYLPGTVNSQQKIFIPTDAQVPNDPNILIPSSVAEDPLTGVSKVDWLMTDTGDVAVNSFGDFRYSSGITNLMQALKLKFVTPKGGILVHPDYGLGIRPGTMNSDVNIQDIYNSINKMILDDPRFSGIDSLQISLIGPTLSISVGVTIYGQNGVFPITFELAN